MENKKRIVWIILACVLVGIAVFIWRVNVPDNGIGGTVERIEDTNRRAGNSIGDAGSAIENAKQDLDDASAGIDRAIRDIKTGDRERQALIDECGDLLERSKANARRTAEIIGDVERADQGNGA